MAPLEVAELLVVVVAFALVLLMVVLEIVADNNSQDIALEALRKGQ